MKKFSTLFLLVALTSTFSSCLKKTNDDPAVSFRSRKARLTGRWVAQKGSVNITQGVWTEGWTITGNHFDYSDPSGSAAGTAVVSFEFDKDGKCDLDITMGGFLTKATGTWNFTGGIGSQKNKTQVVIHFDSYQDASGSNTLQGNQVNLTYDLLELRNKTLHIKMTYQDDDGSGNPYARSEDWTLTLQQ